MRNYLFILTLFLCFKPFSVTGESREVDSLISALKSCKKDTFELKVLNKIAELSSDPEVWPMYNMRMHKLALKLMKSKDQKIKKKAIYYYGNSLVNLGFLYIDKGRLSFALTYFLKGYEMMKKLGDKIGMAAALNNAGYVYKSLGDIPKALETYHTSLKLYEEMKYDKGIANALNNIAILYNKQENLDAAIDFNKRSMEINTRLGDKLAVGISMNNLAILYQKKKGFKVAFEYLEKALVLQKEINDKEGIANSYNNIGWLLEEQSKLKEALTYYTMAYDMLQTIDDKSVLVSTTINIGTLQLKLGNISEAKKFAELGYDLAKRIKYIDELSDAANLLSDVYKQKKMYKEALEMHEYFIKMRDSALNESTKTATMQMQVKYEYGKKAAADSVKNSEEQRVKDAEIRAQKSALKQEQTLKYVLYGGLALFVLISLYVYNRFKSSQEKNRIIALQKQIVDEKQKEVMDSIMYAKRIQDSLLPSEKSIERNLKRLKHK